jgi:hypothetical protein
MQRKTAENGAFARLAATRAVVHLMAGGFFVHCAAGLFSRWQAFLPAVFIFR